MWLVKPSSCQYTSAVLLMTNDYRLSMLFIMIWNILIFSTLFTAYWCYIQSSLLQNPPQLQFYFCASFCHLHLIVYETYLKFSVLWQCWPQYLPVCYFLIGTWPFVVRSSSLLKIIWHWSNDGKTLMGENDVLIEKSVPVPLSNTNSQRTALGSNLGLHGDRPPTTHLSYGMVLLKGVKHL